jgi:hypothetical protein
LPQYESRPTHNSSRSQASLTTSNQSASIQQQPSGTELKLNVLFDSHVYRLSTDFYATQARKTYSDS